ncbi:hypothetical protein [Thalassoglobus neptunius]|uniref:hypothetical protein n=1 Tax=Thalassoglobus neptunius TaxID=1938619 RepID=UPI0018D25BD2|nr:hypothetical protein [Thalassoglobus neptunius]
MTHDVPRPSGIYVTVSSDLSVTGTMSRMTELVSGVTVYEFARLIATESNNNRKF